ncbi:MAG: type VII toxin-antitoxin system MntA family adenylyltransferase antitoxin [Candidatus Asgardarchaeia archaeon]
MPSSLDTSIIKKLKSILKEDNSIIFAYLYGSVARGKEHKFSDIDIAIFFKPPVDKNYRRFLSKIVSIEEKDKEIDVCVLNESPPLLRYNVIRDGILLVDKDPKLREEFVYRTLIEALDFKEVIKRYRKMRLEMFLNVT